MHVYQVAFLAVALASLAPFVEPKFSATKIVCLVNKEREKAGLKPLGISKRLIAAAKVQSVYMAKIGKMTHDNVGKDKTVGNRVDNAGYTWTNVAENVGYGFSSEDEVMDKWMKSPGHKKNIMCAKSKMIGVAIEMKGSTPYWTQVFATDKGNKSQNVPSEEECAKLCNGKAKGAKKKKKKKEEEEKPAEEAKEEAKEEKPKKKKKKKKKKEEPPPEEKKEEYAAAEAKEEPKEAAEAAQPEYAMAKKALKGKMKRMKNRRKRRGRKGRKRGRRRGRK